MSGQSEAHQQIPHKTVSTSDHLNFISHTENTRS